MAFIGCGGASGGGGLLPYSTAEVDTGIRWLNDEHIFKRTYQLNLTRLVARTSTTAIEDANYIDFIVDSTLVIIINNGSKGCENPACWINTDNDVKIKTLDDWDNISYCYLTLYYVKPTV